MKILFVNPPVIRSRYSSPENDFKIDGLIFKPWMRNIKGFGRIYKFMNEKFWNIRYGVRAGSRWPWTMSTPHGGPPFPFIMAYSASYLKSYGYEVNILDAVAEEEYSYKNFIQKVKKETPDIVVIECSTPTIDIDLWIAKKISEFTEVALAGPHLTNKTEEIVKNNSFIKYFLKGEYILSSLEMVKTRNPGVYESFVVKDLDSIPFPFRDYESSIKYFDPTMPTPKPQLQIWGSKGCPYKCIFCLWPRAMYKRVVSLRKPENVAKEIRECVEKYGFKSIFFDDDTFNLGGEERLSKLCDELAKIGLPWTMMGRLDASPKWIFDKMVDCGCVGMRFGIETFDLQVLEKIKKGIERIDFLGILEYITKKHSHLMIHLTMMKDLPGQTEEIHKKDIEILHNLGYSPNNVYRSYQIASCAPFPGTVLYEELAKKIGEYKLKDYRLYDGGKDTVMKDLKKDSL